MLTSALDGLARLRLEWPEALVIDLLADCYAVSIDAEPLAPLARLHARYLRELVEGDPRRAAALRLELIAACAGRGIDLAEIEGADRVVFDELKRTTLARFRNSPRLLAAFGQRLEEATTRLPAHVPPAHRPAETVAWPVRRSPLRLSPQPA